MRRVPELDGLRGLAALAVVTFHLSHHEWLPWGWAAVDVFFALSGYLITSIILREKERPHFLRTFYVRRSLRIWPIYYATIIGLWLWGVAPEGAMPWHLAYLQFTPTYAMPGVTNPPESMPGYWYQVGHTWTLAVEEQFYLFWPLVASRMSRRGVIVAAVSVWGASVLLRAVPMAPILLLTRCDSLAAGALLAAVGFRPGDSRAARSGMLLTAAGAASLAVLYLTNHGRVVNVVKFAGTALVSGGLVALTLSGCGKRWLAWLGWAPIAYLGTVSYGLYLYHNVVRNYWHAVETRLGELPLPAQVAAQFVVSLALAVASWHLFEKPVLSLKRYFEYRWGEAR